MQIKHALVVDDSKSARVMLSRQLQKLGLTVDSVESAKDAFSYLESSRPDLIFMDHMMPGIDGLVAAKLIWNNINTRTIPVVMYTSKDGDEYVQSAKAHGAVAVLPKPAKAHQIETIIERINTILLEEGEMRSTSDDVTAYAGLSQLDVEAIVEASVASAIERFGEENQSTIKELLRGEAERLKGTLNEKMMSAESQIDVLNNQMEEAIENISTQDALCQEVSEKVDAERAESVSYERVNELIAIGVSDKTNVLESEIKSLNALVDKQAEQYEASLNTIVELTRVMSAAGGEGGVDLSALMPSPTVDVDVVETAAEQAISKLAPDFIDSSLEERLTEVSKVYLAQISFVKRSAMFAASLSIIAVGLMFIGF